MKDSKIVAVFGATGAQGGGLARAILEDPASGFTVRALTRYPSSDKAKSLAEQGAEVVAANVDDPADVRAALEGAHAAYFVTFFWDHLSPDRELEQARTMAEAAREAGVRHAIWSTLEDTRLWVPLDDDRMPTLQGKYKVPHFDAKGEADAFFAAAGVPTTYLLTSFYWDNLIHFGMGPALGPDGKLGITMPMGDRPLPGIAAEDIGRCAYGILKEGEGWVGKTVGIAGEHRTGREMADSLSRTLGREVVYRDVPPEVYRGFGFPGADDLGNMFQFKRDFNDSFRAARDVEATRRLNPALQSFDVWLAKNAARIPLPA
ncbi:MAG: NmrA/HSCARG family protein [Fimbriimonadaceae bacterium]|nr:NmrA/HSCARG family protein [Fimbriimonadaceae bacterium]